jgi:hypothetical protein
MYRAGEELKDSITQRADKIKLGYGITLDLIMELEWVFEEFHYNLYEKIPFRLFWVRL